MDFNKWSREQAEAGDIQDVIENVYLSILTQIIHYLSGKARKH